MKRFKLLKWYPSLPKDYRVGDLVRFADNCYRDILGNLVELKDNVENNPEFWEEIINEKTFEVLSLRSYYGSDFIYDYSEATLRENGLYLNSNDKQNNGLYTLEHAFEHNYKIHSVIRWIDGEIFTVGDSIVDNDGKVFEIQGFNLPTDEMNWYTLGVIVDTENDCGVDLSEAKKYIKKKPLYVTEDGVDLYEGDSYWFIWTTDKTPNRRTFENIPYFWKNLEDGEFCDNVKVFSTESAAKKYVELHTVLYVTEDGVDIHVGDTVYYVLSNLYLRNYKPTKDDRDTLAIHYFSTEEKAREYIKLNTPKYSINNIIEAWDFINENDWKLEKDTLLFYLTEN